MLLSKSAFGTQNGTTNNIIHLMWLFLSQEVILWSSRYFLNLIWVGKL